MKNEGTAQGYIAQLFQDRAKELNISHAALSEMLSSRGMKTSASSVSKMLSGERGISMEMAMRLCDLLDVRWEDLYLTDRRQSDYQSCMDGIQRWLTVIDGDLDQTIAAITMSLVYMHRILALSGHPDEWSGIEDPGLDVQMQATVSKDNQRTPEIELNPVDINAWREVKEASMAVLHNLIKSSALNGGALAKAEKVLFDWNSDDGSR